ncbi:MAG TPA: hypothetical protein VNB94_04035 [Mycobacteriales bacterium]|nr:hypothetical protein [Mycobacteriales bacterium]
MARTGIRAAATGAVATMAISGAVLTGLNGAHATDSRQIAGTWQVTVQPDGAPSTAAFESTLVYTATGSVIETTSKAPASAGLGAWERLGSGRYAMTFQKYRFNGPTYVGKTVIEEVQYVSPDGSQYTGRATTTVYDAAGNVVATISATATGSRMAASS